MEDALEIHAYYSKMFEAFAMLPADDIRRALLPKGPEYTLKGRYRDYHNFLTRLKSYAERSNLDPARRQVIIDYWTQSAPLSELASRYPECRSILQESDRSDLKERFLELADDLSAAWAPSWYAGSASPTTEEILHEIAPSLGEDARARLEVIANRLSVLNARAAQIPAGACARSPYPEDAINLISNKMASGKANEPAANSGLTLRQIALLSIYRRVPLTRPQADEVAHAAGYTSPTSGRKLMEHYNALDRPSERINVAGEALRAMLKAIEGVIPHLTGGSKQQAQSELQTLEAKR